MHPNDRIGPPLGSAAWQGGVGRDRGHGEVMDQRAAMAPLAKALNQNVK